MIGAVLEAFVGTERTKQITLSTTLPTLFQYRRHTGHEVGFVLKDAAGRLVGV